MKKYKSDIGPIQSSYANVQANEILGKSWKAQSIFFDFKKDQCVPEFIPNIKVSHQYEDMYNNATLTWKSSNGNSLEIEFETIHQLSRLIIEPVPGHDFIESFTLEAFDSNSLVEKFTFGNSSVYR